MATIGRISSPTTFYAARTTTISSQTSGTTRTSSTRTDTSSTSTGSAPPVSESKSTNVQLLAVVFFNALVFELKLHLNISLLARYSTNKNITKKIPDSIRSLVSLGSQVSLVTLGSLG